jgi:hypothetical protein
MKIPWRELTVKGGDPGRIGDMVPKTHNSHDLMMTCDSNFSAEFCSALLTVSLSFLDIFSALSSGLPALMVMVDDKRSLLSCVRMMLLCRLWEYKSVSIERTNGQRSFPYLIVCRNCFASCGSTGKTSATMRRMPPI